MKTKKHLNTKQDKRKKDIPGLLFIIPGALLIIVKIIDGINNWSIVDIIKILFGLSLIGYGIYLVLKK